jgi:hypothetical protein
MDKPYLMIIIISLLDLNKGGKKEYYIRIQIYNLLEEEIPILN